VEKVGLDMQYTRLIHHQKFALVTFCTDVEGRSMVLNVQPSEAGAEGSFSLALPTTTTTPTRLLATPFWPFTLR
jgi:hypothetical protein